MKLRMQTNVQAAVAVFMLFAEACCGGEPKGVSIANSLNRIVVVEGVCAKAEKSDLVEIKSSKTSRYFSRVVIDVDKVLHSSFDSPEAKKSSSVFGVLLEEGTIEVMSPTVVDKDDRIDYPLFMSSSDPEKGIFILAHSTALGLVGSPHLLMVGKVSKEDFAKWRSNKQKE